MKNIEKEIGIPDAVSVEVNGRRISAKGKHGEIAREFNVAGIAFENTGKAIVIRAGDAKKKTEKIVNTVAAHIKNILNGAGSGFEYKLKVVYSHFPINVSVKGDRVEINNFTGEKKPRIAGIVGSTKVSVKGQMIDVEGPDKEAVGQTAANMEQATRISGKDRRVFQDGIYITSKPKGVK